MKHSRNGLAVAPPRRVREGFTSASRALHEDVAGAEGFSHTDGGFLKASQRRHGRLHLETIRQIMTSPRKEEGGAENPDPRPNARKGRGRNKGDPPMHNNHALTSGPSLDCVRVD